MPMHSLQRRMSWVNYPRTGPPRLWLQTRGRYRKTLCMAIVHGAPTLAVRATVAV